MPTAKLNDILFKENKQFKYKQHDFKNRKEWNIHRIFEEAWFNCNEDVKKLIEDDVIARGDKTLWLRYMAKIQNFSEYHQLQTKAYYYLGANDIETDVNTHTELEATYQTLKQFNTEIAILPKSKTFDSNAVRKEISTRQTKLRDLQPQLKAFINNNYPEISERRTTHIIKLLTSC
jgi:hypothetical protein